MHPQEDLSTSTATVDTCDLLVVGSGIAGLMAALRAGRFCRVLLITKSTLEEGSTRYAQGGIAFAIGTGDSAELHAKDTLAAGAGLCDKEAVNLLVSEGTENFEELIELGAMFDRDNGEINLHLEGGHSLPRVVHAGDTTGAEVERAMCQAARGNSNITIREGAFLIDLIIHDNVCTGAIIRQNGRMQKIQAKAVVLATGGAGQLYEVTTNPTTSTGDGVAIAYKAGARIGDMEFTQFHPTALYENDSPRFLISEAVRGEGAHLLDASGERFMVGLHALAELAPRDVVVRQMARRMIETGSKQLFLDLRHIQPAKLKSGFPTIVKTLAAKGFNFAKEPIPIAFAAHYTIGGVVTNLHGCSSIRGLYACGETACTGVHGANRLASNSLLEGLVYSRRIVGHFRGILGDKGSKGEVFRGETAASLPDSGNNTEMLQTIESLKRELAREMMTGAGVFRSRKSLENLQHKLSYLRSKAAEVENRLESWFPAIEELSNMLCVADLMSKSALAREESRGTHQREEYPEPIAAWGRQHVVFEQDRMFTVSRLAEGIDW